MSLKYTKMAYINDIKDEISLRVIPSTHKQSRSRTALLKNKTPY